MQRSVPSAHAASPRGAKRPARKGVRQTNASRLNGDSAGKGHALPLTAGRLMGIAFFKVLQMHGVQSIAYTVVQILGVSSRPQPKYYIFKYRHVRSKGKILKYKAEIPLLRRQVDLSFFGKTAGTVQPDLTIVRRFQSGDHPQQRRNASILDGQRFGPDDLPLINPYEIWFNQISTARLFSAYNDKSCRETAKSAISAMLNSRKARKALE